MPVKNTRRIRTSRDTGALLADMLQLELGMDVPIQLKKERPWASITFSGIRYRFEIDVRGEASHQPITQKIARLVDHEFDLPGHFVADVLMHEKRSDEAFIAVEILMIADPVSE